MNFQNIKYNKYIKVLSRLGKQFSPVEGLLIMIRSYLTNNVYYYIFCIVFRALFLIMISGNYLNPFLHINSQVIQDSSKIFSLHYVFKNFTLNYNDYIKICIVLYSLFIIRILMTLYIMSIFSHYKFSNSFPVPFKYQIIVEHLIFLFFPFLIEFLVIPYYIYYCKEKFVIKCDQMNKGEIILIMIINTFLILVYNFHNYIYMTCSNKNYTNNDSEAILRTKNESVFENSFVSYRDSNPSFFCFIIIQNVPLIQNIENYLGDKSITYYKATISIIFAFIMIIIIRERAYLYNYANLINTLIAVLLLFCFYSIALDIIFYLYKYIFKNWLNELIYIVEKFLIAYITYLLIIYRCNRHLEKQITNILFQEKNIKNKEDFTNAFIYLNQIMIQIKEKNNEKQNILLINFLNLHITKCNKLDCNCKLLSAVLRNDINDNRNIREKNYTSNLLLVLNYLYESLFIEYDYYNNYNLTILLAEHYCHLVNNPTMAFSFIISLLIRQKNKLKKMQKIILYELCEKYIYSIFSKFKIDDENEESLKDVNLLMNKQKFEYFQNYFIILKTSYYTKILMNQYINNLIKILKYKSIFEDTLTINYDEGNDMISNVQINFFNLNSNIKSNFNESNSNKKKSSKKKYNHNNENTSNIYKVIKILKKEQLLNKNIINSIKDIDIFKDIPIFIIYKYYLFFDIFKDGEIPMEIFSKLNLFLSRYGTIYNNKITNSIYILLRKLYMNQNNISNSKFCAIFEFKKEIKTKYFDEYLSLKLGYKQRDIINEKIDELMPKEFSSSHQNMIKRVFIGEQKRFFKIEKNCIFDATHTVMNLIDMHGIMIYNLSNYLIMILEISFTEESDYIFMLNHNFDLIANTKNFTDDYLLNQKIFHKYKLKLLDMLKTKPEKITQKFSETFKTIDEQKEIRQIKTDEYFIPQIYVPLGEKNAGMMQINNYNLKKNKYISKFVNINNDINENKIAIGSIADDNEQERLIKIEKNKDEIFDTLLNSGEYIIHKSYSFSLNKMKFVENVAKELTKILDNELTTDNNYEQNLVIGSKKLISDLLMKSDLLNSNLIVEIKMNYYYDRPFYFININDEKKSMMKLTKYISENRRKINRIPSPASNYFKQGSNKLGRKLLNSNTIKKEVEENDSMNIFDSKKRVVSPLINLRKETNDHPQNLNKKEVLEKIDKYRERINKDQFILIIKLCLFIIITGILIIYILNMILQRRSINMTEKILLTYYYNAETKNIILNIFSKLLGSFHDLSGLTTTSLSTTYQSSILSYATELRKYYHDFNKYFIEYNIDMGNSFQLIYNSHKFNKLRGSWKEIVYDSEYCSELDFTIHSIFLVDNDTHEGLIKDVDLFMFYQNKSDSKEKINTSFIRLIFYFSVNYESTYKQIYDEINSEIFISYKQLTKKGTIRYYLLEIGSLVLYFFFFICCFIYLYYSNIILLRNIIFLFLDFSQAPEDKSSNFSSVSDVIGKLLKFQNLINDFNLSNIRLYSDYLDKKNTFDINNENTLDGRDSKKTKLHNFHNKKFNLNNLNNSDNNNSQSIDTKSKKTNNSSQNILIRNNSRLMPEKLNPAVTRGDYLLNQNNANNSSTSTKGSNLRNGLISSQDSSNSLQIKKSLNWNKINNNNKSFMSDTNMKDDFEDAVLDRSNRVIIYIIKIHSVVIIFFMVIILGYSIYKLKNNAIFIEQYQRFYSDFQIIEERYTSLYYYWNTLKTVMIFHCDEERWINMSKILENMNSEYERITNNYNQLLTKKMDFYDEVENLFEIFTYNKNDSIHFLQKNVCPNDTNNCYNYLLTNDSIFNSGIDFGYKICFSYMNNIFMDYQSLKNKTSIEEIKNTITDDKFYEFKRMRKSFTNVFYYLKLKIFTDFKTEAVSFGHRYKNIVLALNIISLIISILILLFVIIFIFITVTNYSQPIKDSTYRINHSFFYIKNFSLTKTRKRDSAYYIYQTRN